MKANRAYQNRDDRAEVGVGTLIVFIAMVLVAAVAAAVLINTTGTLQQRAQATGKEATQEVSSNLKVLNVYGNRTNTADDPHHFKVYTELSAGALPLDLSKVVIRWSDGADVYTYTQASDDTNVSDGDGLKRFSITCIRGDCSDSDTVMESGDLVEFLFSLPTGSYLAERKAVELTLTPEVGSPVSADFKSPPTYGTAKIITLR